VKKLPSLQFFLRSSAAWHPDKVLVLTLSEKMTAHTGPNKAHDKQFAVAILSFDHCWFLAGSRNLTKTARIEA